MAHDVNFKTVPLSDIYKGVSDYLHSDDLSFINLEFPVDETRKQSSYPSFNVHPDYIKAAIDGGFDVFSLANNHINDFGITSLNKTIDNMNKFRNKEMIIFSGVYLNNDSDFNIETIQIEELTIGYIAITQFNNNYWNKEGASKVYKADYLIKEEADSLIAFIEKEKENYDCLIVSYHGGIEYKPSPKLERKVFFERLRAAGADIIWGHHPHVLQPWNSFNDEGGDSLILYSTGNFLSGQLAIVDPAEHDINFAATGFSSLFRVEIGMEEGVFKIYKIEPIMIANIRNENNFFVAVNQEDALNFPMDTEWKSFYTKMFSIAEERIRQE
ncbi:MAG: CapA family protein [Spirochaetales bacterium]|nr:CapA family protein [Spirochaetales bacterium]